MNLQPHQQRVVEEHQDLCGKLDRLSSFQDTETFAALPDEEKDRLKRQKLHMFNYRDVLAERIATFPRKAEEGPQELGTASEVTKGGFGHVFDAPGVRFP